MTAALQRAQALLDVGRWDAAAEQVTKHLAAEPDDAFAWSLLARARIGADDAAGALEAAGRSAALGPHEEWAHRLASVALRRQGRLPEAAAAAREAVRLAPDQWQTHAQLARVLAVEPPMFADWALAPTATGLPRLTEAWRAASTAVALGPLEADTHAVIGTVALATGDLGTAERAFTEALRLDPGDAQHLNDLALVAERRGGLTRAAGGFAAAAAADPREPAAAYNVLVVGWSLLRRLLFALGALAYVLAGASNAEDEPAVLGPLFTSLLLVVAGVCVITLRRLPRPVRGVLWRAARRGWGLPTVALTATSAVLLAAAPWAPTADVRGVLGGSALLTLLGALLLSVVASRRLSSEYDQRHGR